MHSSEQFSLTLHLIHSQLHFTSHKKLNLAKLLDLPTPLAATRLIIIKEDVVQRCAHLYFSVSKFERIQCDDLYQTSSNFDPSNLSLQTSQKSCSTHNATCTLSSNHLWRQRQQPLEVLTHGPRLVQQLKITPALPFTENFRKALSINFFVASCH